MTTPKVLLFSLFGFTLLASFFFAFTESQPALHRSVLLGRRNLLSNKDLDVKDDDDDFLGEVVPRKKKALISDDDDDDTDFVAKKKSSEMNIKKKKSPPSSETKTKSSSVSNEDDKQVEKKKKSSSVSNEDEKKQVEKKKKSSSSSSSLSSSSSKNQTKIIKPKITSNMESNSSKKNATNPIKPSVLSTSSSKNKTKIIKPTTKKVDDSSLNNNNPTITKSKLNKVNSTSKSSNNKSQDRPKSSQSDKTDGKDLSKQKYQNQNQMEKSKPQSSPGWMYQPDEDEEDLVSEFRHLPTKFHQSFVPDLHRISTTSKIYINKYNKQITKGFKPYFGNKYAPTIAASISFLFILLPLLLVSLIFNRIKAYFSIQKLIIFIQIYLSIYFSILCFSSLITGLEPLRFFYSTSQETYLWLQVLQTLAYVLYLLLLLMYLVLVFSTESGLGQKFLGLAQTFVGFAVGLHYYMTVFHRVVLRQPPKSSWKFHGIYATCFLVICLFAGAERRKKVYLVEGSEEGKTS